MNTTMAKNIFKNENALVNFINGKSFRCVSNFLSWLEIGKKYQFEYLGFDEYKVKDGQYSGKSFIMSQHQLISCFAPTFIEENLSHTLVWGHWLASRGVCGTTLDKIINYYAKTKNNITYDKH